MKKSKGMQLGALLAAMSLLRRVLVYIPHGWMAGMLAIVVLPWQHRLSVVLPRWFKVRTNP